MGCDPDKEASLSELVNFATRKWLGGGIFRFFWNVVILQDIGGLFEQRPYNWHHKMTVKNVI